MARQPAAGACGRARRGTSYPTAAAVVLPGFPAASRLHPRYFNPSYGTVPPSDLAPPLPDVRLLRSLTLRNILSFGPDTPPLKPKML